MKPLKVEDARDTDMTKLAHLKETEARQGWHWGGAESEYWL